MAEEFTWWEKTVEYLFVQQAGLEKFITPLDGTHEQAGDATVYSDFKWTLIEFKRCIKSLSSEKKKFDHYSSAKKELESRDGHHFIVYGKLTDDRDSVDASLESLGLELVFQTYFGRKQAKSIDEMLQFGTDIVTFNEYLKDFTAKKKQKKDTASGGLEMDSYCNVLGVHKTGDHVKAMSLRDFALEHSIVLSPNYLKRHERTLG